MKRLFSYSSLFFLFLLSACSNNSSQRYSIKQDEAPNTPIALAHIEDSIPQYEAYSLGGNKDYQLKGQTYRILKEVTDYKERGQASWYGKKFHGHKTANGEIYDMYSMSAAHKTLPLPSYVRVTNLDNGLSTIVRVNDRGPFYAGRIIDLSYAAAHKLDMLRSGVANVEIEVITLTPQVHQTNNTRQRQYVIQIMASQDKEKIRTLSQELSQKLATVSFVESTSNHHRLMLGPFSDSLLAQATLEQVQQIGYQEAFLKQHLPTSSR